MSEGFFRAVRQGHLRQVACLVRSGVSLRRVRDASTGQSALVVALHITDPRQRLRTFKYLYRHGADPGAVESNTGRDVFTWACFLDCTTEALQLLQDLRGDLDFQMSDNTGRTALHYAAVNGNVELIREILDYMRKYSLGVDMRDLDGFTPYLLAQRMGHKQCAGVLLEAGASPKQLDTKNMRSVDDWVWIGEREKSFFVRESIRNECGLYKLLGRLPALQAANYQPKYINIVESKLDKIFLSKKERPNLNKSCEVSRQQTWLDFDRIKAKRLTKSLPNFHLPPLEEVNEERTKSTGSNPLEKSIDKSIHRLKSNSVSTLGSSSPTTSLNNSNHNHQQQQQLQHQQDYQQQHRVSLPSVAESSSVSSSPDAAPPSSPTHHEPRHSFSTSHQPRHTSLTSHVPRHSFPTATNPPRARKSSEDSIPDIMRVLQDQCTHSYRPFVKRKVIVVPAITVHKVGRSINESPKNTAKNKLKNHIMAKSMAKRLMGKRNTSSKLSAKISTISEEA